jgi:hypothetical protein
MLFRNVTMMVLSGTILTGCLESEKACYQRLKKDFESSRNFATGSCLDSISSSRCNDYDTIALKSQIRINYIYNDDDQNACDYISDGPYLRRK